MVDFVRDNWDELMQMGFEQVQRFAGAQTVKLSDALELFMSLHTQEEALPVLMVAYSLASQPPDCQISKLVKDGMIKRFNDLS